MKLFFLALCSTALWAQPPLQFAELRDFKLESGQGLASCRVGYRTYGALNAERSNAILFPTWFGGRSENLDGFIGPGKMVDSSRFFVITVDALANGVSCSPSQSAGSFPAITIGDMVASQYRLATEILKLPRLHAVMGISMGGMQTYEWITAHPEFVNLAVPIVGSPKLTMADLLLWQAELGAIEAVQRSGGDPRSAMPAVRAMHEFALHTPHWLTTNRPPATFAEFMARQQADSQSGISPLDYAAQLRAMMAQDISRRFNGSMESAGAAVRARVLTIVATEDHMVNPEPALALAASAGWPVVKLSGICGHQAPGCEAGTLNTRIPKFLKQ
ncbi:MAG: alpha/beta fold hydrolase [Acidobacteria bacterium]|nr:alpha/beta fold hydrolase [Acidobacteriota bacterium]